MAYQLKSTGIAANCTMCIAVDPDTGTLKDFASSAVTADMVVDGDLVISDGTWDGNTRKKITLSAGNYIGFGTTKPSVSLTSTDAQLTAVMCVEAAGGAVRVFGLNSTNYFASQNLAAGTNFPTFRNSSNVAQGSASVPTSGQKWIFGASMTWNTSTTLYRALHDAASMSSESGTTFNVSTSYSPSYIGRRDDSTTQQNDGIFLVALFNTALSEAQWSSLRDDWFGTLLESAGGGSTLMTKIQQMGL